jgi:hypothetical protein
MAIQAPQYPAPIAPSFQSFAERQRMAIDDALAAAEAQEERVYGVAKEGAKAGYEYDKMLRGYMEAKYASPNLTFWEYSTKPSVAGAYRAEGRKQIAEHISGGGDIKDIPGMTFGARQKAGLRGFLGADKREREVRLADIAKDDPRVQKIAEQEMAKVTAELPESQLASLKDIGKDVEGVRKKGEKFHRISEGITDLGYKQYGEDQTLVKLKEKISMSGADVRDAVYDAQSSIENVMERKPLTKMELSPSDKSGLRTDESFGPAELVETKPLPEVLKPKKSEVVPQKYATQTWKEAGQAAPAGVAGTRPEGGPFKTTFDPETGKYAKTLETNVSMREGKLYRMGEGGGAQGTYFGDVEGSGMPVFNRPITKGKDVVGSAQVFKFTDPEGASSYYEAAAKGTDVDSLRWEGQSKFLETAGADFDPEVMKHHGMKKLDIDPSIIESAGGPGEYFKSEAFTKAHTVPEIAGEAVGEAAKGGLKEALGKGVAGVGYAASIGAGISKLQSKDETAQLGGAIQTAGGVAGLVAMTNFWNPVGWAAAIPAVLSVGGGLMGGGGKGLAGTPIGRYRRRVGIG